MKLFCFRKRAPALFLFLFLLSCSPYRRAWEGSSIDASYPCTTYKRCVLKPSDPFCGIEAEFLIGNATTTLFLNAKTLQFPIGNNPCLSTVAVCIDENAYTFEADRLQGGQRLKMPPEATELILAGLLNGSWITVTVGSYHDVLVTDSFPQ